MPSPQAIVARSSEAGVAVLLSAKVSASVTVMAASAVPPPQAIDAVKSPVIRRGAAERNHRLRQFPEIYRLAGPPSNRKPCAEPVSAGGGPAPW